MSIYRILNIKIYILTEKDNSLPFQGGVKGWLLIKVLLFQEGI